ncbi:MAG: hypothetical protein ACUVTH_14625, partial [Thermogutta sp.]
RGKRIGMAGVFGVRRLASTLIRRQLAVADETLNAKATVSCRITKVMATCWKEEAAASCRTP